MMSKLNTISIPTILTFVSLALLGCAGGQAQQKRGFFTSGSREADQRADQRMASVEEVRGSAKENGSKNPLDPNKAQEAQKSLYDRLGGEEGVKTIVDDFVNRALEDPIVNWERKGVKRGGMTLKRGQSVEWKRDNASVEQLKKHIAQLIALKTGGPSFYDGKDMKGAHAGMHITNSEFDAAVGDLKATLDNKKVADKEERELLAIIESTRAQVVEHR